VLVVVVATYLAIDRLHRDSSGRPGGTSSPAVDTPTCAAADIGLSLGRIGAAGGSFGRAILITNHGPACVISGYSTLVATNGGAALRTVDPALQTVIGGAMNTSEPPVVRLASGQTASELVSGANAPVNFGGSGGACVGYRSFLLTLPGTSTPVRLAMTIADCGRLNIGPVVDGATGTHSY
jgi:hypothetical protein